MDVSGQRIKRTGQDGKGVAYTSPPGEPVDEILKLTQFSVDKASDEIFWIGPDGRVIFVNDAACATLGYTKAELQDMYVWDFDPDFPPEQWQSAWQELKEQGSRTFETRHKSSDGRVFPVEITANYLNFDGKEYDFAFVRDITDRKQAEEARLASEARLNSIFRSAPAGIGVVLNRVITEANDRLCEMTGFSRDELIGHSARRLYPAKEEYERVGKVKYEMITERGSGHVETRWRRKDGTVIDVLLSSAPIVPGDLSAGVTFTALDITGRKRVEDEVTRLASIVTSSDDAIISKSPDNVITSWNRGAERLYGYTAAEAVGRPVSIIVPPERAHEVQEILGKIRLGDRIEHHETERMTKDGRRIAVSITISPIYDAAGNVVGASTIARDITEQKRAERALKKSQYILAKSQEMAHVGNWAWNLQTGDMNWSDEGFRIFGFRPQEAKPSLEWLLSRVHPDDYGIVSGFAAEACGKGLRSSIDYRIVRPDGSVRYVNTLLDKVARDETGRPKWAYGINQDITRRKGAEERLKKSQYILAKSQEMAHVGNWAWNPRTDEFNGSDESYRIYGYRPGEFTPSVDLIMARVHPDDRALVEGMMEAARSQGRRGSVDFRVVHPDGSIRYVNILADRIIRDRDGTVRWVYGITQDITDRKQTEKALEEAKARAELYIDLMGHDINNMNQIALGFLELALDDPGLGEATRKSLTKSLESIRASSRLIRNVRKLQQIKTGGMSQSETDVDRVLRQVRDAYAKVPGVAATVNYTPASAGCKVVADELLYDVFANILENAIKHACHAPVVDIQLDQTSQGGRDYCRITVEDNGPGIPDDLKHAVFDRMRRGDTKAKGSGLGLYLVRTLVESYGGRVWVEDRVQGDRSGGSRFVVLLPSAGRMD